MSGPQVNDAVAADAAVLCVDLDGTLIATDTLWESILLLIRHHPWIALRMPFWVMGGKAAFKRRLANHVVPDVTTLPYRADVIEFLREQKAAGRKLVLATATDQRIARAVADHLKLFDDVIATDGQRNASGEVKLEIIRAHCGVAGFDYIGDRGADVPLWASAKRAYLVQPSSVTQRRAREVCQPARVFESPSRTAHWAVRALRAHQWSKNLLIFLPLLLAHAAKDPRRVSAVCIAFVAFSLCASAVYIFNDLLDLEADRQHPTKCKRPVASGRLSITTALVEMLVCLAIGLALAVGGVGWLFTAMLVIYMIVTTAYSIELKRRLLLDVICLAALYTHRVVSGAVAASVELTPWLIAFSMFFFLSLAFAKRYAELIHARLRDVTQIKGRNYSVADLDIIQSVGPAAGYMSVLVFALYINSDLVGRLYARPKVLWLMCPILLYWITRLWFVARRGALTEDPVVFALKDRVSWYAGAVLAALALAATVHWS